MNAEESCAEARHLWESGRLIEAIRLMRTALLSVESALGNNCIESLPILHALAIYLSQYQPLDIVEHLGPPREPLPEILLIESRAIDTARRFHPQTQRELEFWLRRHAMSRLGIGDAVRARECLLEVIESCRVAYGDSASATQSAMAELLTVLVRMEAWEEALPYARITEQAAVESYAGKPFAGPRIVARSYLGRVLGKLGQPEEAAEHLTAAIVEVRSRSGGGRISNSFDELEVWLAECVVEK